MKNKVVISGFVDSTENVEFQPEENCGYIAVSVSRYSGALDKIIVQIPDYLKGKFKKWDFVTVTGKFRSRWARIGDKKKELFYIESESIQPYETDENSIELVGFVCKKPVYRKTSYTKKRICELCVAVNDKERSDYIECICWDENALKVANNYKVGTKVTLHGRIQSRPYPKKLPGGKVQERTAYEVSVYSIEMEDRE